MKIVAILLYHEVLPDSEKESTHIKNTSVMSESKFKEQMEYLHNNSFTTISSEDLIAYLYKGAELPEKSVLLTFDDGYDGNIKYAYPILKEYGFTAIIYTITDNLPETMSPWGSCNMQFFSENEMLSHGDVFEFASHTNSMHRMVDDEASALQHYSVEEIKKDILKSFEYKLNAKTSIAYPYGRYNERTIEALKELDIKFAVTVEGEYVKKSDDPYHLGRFIAYAGMNLGRFKEIVNY